VVHTFVLTNINANDNIKRHSSITLLTEEIAMTTQAQIDANRRNAQQSTGPRTAEGKARVSRNAITHGLTCRDVVLPEERMAEFDHYRDAMVADHQPVGAEEQDLVEHMVAAQWRLRRLWRSERGIYATARYRLGEPAANVGICVLFDAQHEKGFVTLDRRESTFNREYHRCSRRLQTLQDLRRKGLRHVLDEEAQSETPAATDPNLVAEPAAPPALAASASTGSATGKTAKQSQSPPVRAPALPNGTRAPAASASVETASAETAEQSRLPGSGAIAEAQLLAPEPIRQVA
jgi:hypothetical protein